MLSLRLFVHCGQRYNGQRHRLFFTGMRLNYQGKYQPIAKRVPNQIFPLIALKYEVGECQTRVGNDY